MISAVYITHVCSFGPALVWPDAKNISFPLNYIFWHGFRLVPLQPQGKLEVNRRILEAYVPYIGKFKRQFGAFSAARDVTNRLQEIKWTVENVIYFSQVIQRVLMKVSDKPFPSHFASILVQCWTFFLCQFQVSKNFVFQNLIKHKSWSHSYKVNSYEFGCYAQKHNIEAITLFKVWHQIR